MMPTGAGEARATPAAVLLKKTLSATASILSAAMAGACGGYGYRVAYIADCEHS